MDDVHNYLKKIDLEYSEFKHKAVHTVEESKLIKNKIPGMHCKTLFLKDIKGKFYCIGIKADKRLDTKKLKSNLDVKKIQFASEEELYHELKLKPGSVSIFGMIHASNTTLILDKEVWESDFVGFHPNINTSTLVIDHNNLEKYVKSLNSSYLVLDL